MTRIFMAIASVLLWAVVWPAMAIDTVKEFDDPVLQARYQRLIHELRCVQCQNNSIADSPVGLAADLRRQVHELVEQGKSEAQVREFMTERYGDFILYRPPFAPRTWLLWLAPLLLLVGGGWIAYRVVSARSALVGAPGDDEVDEPESDESRAQ